MIRLLKRYCLLCLASALAACSDDQPANGGDDDLPAGLSRVELVLSAEPALSTRAGDDANALDNEMMKTALVVMCSDKTNMVERIIPVDMGGNAWSERRSVAIITTENGSYTFYSFGNIAWTIGTNSVTIEGKTFTVGSAVPEGMDDLTCQADFNNYTIPATGIPMTNKETFTIGTSTTITLHLIRQLSKVRFDFTNATDHELVVQKVEMGQVSEQGTPIWFLPHTDAQGKPVINFPGEVTNTTLVAYEDATGIELTEKDGAKDNASTPLCYFNESETKNPLGQTPLVITTKQKNAKDEDVVVKRNAMMNLASVSRNSFVTVPITLTDYGMELRAFALAPIGGYPPYKLEMKDDEFYCTISAAAGDFTLRPFLYKFEDKDKPERWFDLTDKTKVDSYKLTVAGDAIFTTEPHFDAATGEIMATLSGNTGTATVTLTANIIIGTSPKTTLEYTRKLYIIVE